MRDVPFYGSFFGSYDLLCRGIKESSRFNTIVTLVNLACIAFVLVAGYSKIQRKNYTPFAPKGMAGVASGASVVFFSFIGFDTVATAAEEVRNPGRDLPMGIIGSLAICTALYVAMCAVITGMVSSDKIDTDAPFAVAFRSSGMGWAESIVSAGALAGITTSLLVNLLGQPRIYMTMSRDGLLPPWYGRLHPRFGTPVNATLVAGISAGLLAFAVNIDALSQLVNIGTLCVFAFVCSATLARRYLPPDAEPAPAADAAGGGPTADEMEPEERAVLRSAVLRRVVGVAASSLGFAFSLELCGRVSSRPGRAALLLLLAAPCAVAFLVLTAGFMKLPQRCVPLTFRVPYMPWTYVHSSKKLAWLLR
jgi:APA family basic amino acid/polyamine antiporter